MALEAQLRSLTSAPAPWSPPLLFPLSDPQHEASLRELLTAGVVVEVVDPLDAIVDDLAELRHPAEPAAQAEFREAALSQGSRFGTWVYFPWNHTLVRYPDKEDHQALRTFRNRELITAAEQKRLAATSIAVLGLSVGSNILDQLVQSGIGGTYAFGDFDALSPTNLNRVRASMGQVGLRKTEVAARKMSEADPYLTQVHLDGGYTSASDTVLDAANLDLIVEEVDDVTVKAQVRRYAASRGIPVLTVADVADKAVLDVERHDLRPVKPFNGKIPPGLFARMLDGALPPQEKTGALIKIVGARHLTPRMLRSVMGIGTTLGGIPQLGATATAAGAITAVAARELLLGRAMKSGSYVYSPKRILGLQHQTSLPEATRTVRAFARHRKQT